MRRLADRDVMKKAGVAAVASGVLCLPRLMMWEDRVKAWWLMGAILVWAMFFLWLFVFAWHEHHGGGKVVRWKVEGRIWLVVVVASVLWGVFLAAFVDPSLKAWNPKEFPTDGLDVLARVAFAVSLESLFLLFAPFALMIRLTGKVGAAYGLTLVFVMLVAGLKMISLEYQLSAGWMLALFAMRLLGSGVLLLLYLRKGVLPVWVAGFLIGIRNLW